MTAGVIPKTCPIDLLSEDNLYIFDNFVAYAGYV
jgi:hypothetical protein